jgi:hypothetical protein
VKCGDLPFSLVCIVAWWGVGSQLVGRLWSWWLKKLDARWIGRTEGGCAAGCNQGAVHTSAADEVMHQQVCCLILSGLPGYVAHVSVCTVA